jgi:hypothetical protein
VQIKKMKKTIDALNESLKTMEAFHEDLAHALGACPFCWGEDETCRACRGRGKPGAFEPDKALFQALVLPATKRFTKK